MNNRFQSLVSGAVLAVVIGWVLHVGKEIFVPIIFGALLVYAIAGLARLLGRGHRAPELRPLHRLVPRRAIVLSGFAGTRPIAVLLSRDGRL